MVFTGSEEAQPVPFAADVFFPQSYVTSSLGTLECSFAVFRVWLVGFLTKMSNLHYVLFFSCTLSHSMISEGCTRGYGSGRCLICVSLWWQKPLVTHFHTHAVPLTVVLWSRSRSNCGWKIISKEKDFSAAGLVPMAIQILSLWGCQKA